MPRILHFGFKFVWLASAIAFALLAHDAYHFAHIALPKYQDRVKDVAPGMGIRLGGVSVQDMIDVANGIADTHNKTVEVLEASIHRSMGLSFRLNLLGCFTSLIGLGTQFAHYRHDETQKAKRKHGASDDDGGKSVVLPHLTEGENQHGDTTST